jgi:uncharacterized protein
LKSKKILIIFIKNPEKGNVKTRLAKTAGDETAYQIYKKLISHTLEVAEKLNIEKQLWYSDYVDENDGIDSDVFKKFRQSEGNLGQRMSDAFRSSFEEKCGKAVIIGSDCPGISSELLEQAFDALDSHDTVIGPANDGGYYLLGMNRFFPSLFDGIAWSTNSVFDQTMAAIEKMGLRGHRLPEMIDIDTERDLKESGFGR